MLNQYTNVGNETTTLFTGFLIAGLVAGLIVYVILAISWSKLFACNNEKSYKAWIPVYNAFVLMRIIGMNPWMVLLYFIPVANLFILALVSVRVAETFKRGAGFAVGLLFLPFVCYPILAFSNTDKKEQTKNHNKKYNKEDLSEEVGGIICPSCGTKLAFDTTSCFICGETFDKKEMSLFEPENKEENKNMDQENHVDEKLNVEAENDSTPTFDINEVVESYNEPVVQEEIKVEDKETSALEDMLKVEDTYDREVVPEESSPYKSSTKTLDEILKINSSLYADMEAKKNQKEQEETEKKDISNLDEMFSNNGEEIEKVEPLKETKQAHKVLRKGSQSSHDEIEISKVFMADKLPDEAFEETKRNINLEQDVDQFLREFNTLGFGHNEDQEKVKQEEVHEEPEKAEKESKMDINMFKSIPNHDTLEEENIEIYDKEATELLNKINEVNQTNKKEEEREIKEETTMDQVKTCKKCGSTIPRYSQRCLLCGEAISDKITKNKPIDAILNK